MSKHKHTQPKTCEHDLKFCDHCDMVYCTLCEKEWDIFNAISNQTYLGKQTQPIFPNKDQMLFGVISINGGV